MINRGISGFEIQPRAPVTPRECYISSYLALFPARLLIRRFLGSSPRRGTELRDVPRWGVGTSAGSPCVLLGPQFSPQSNEIEWPVAPSRRTAAGPVRDKSGGEARRRIKCAVTVCGQQRVARGRPKEGVADVSRARDMSRIRSAGPMAGPRSGGEAPKGG
jgi:hypothetical protein